jgi:diaminopimelate epimerase
MQVLDQHTIKLRVYERGAGETLACGTGACAAVVAGIRRGLLASPVKVYTRGGALTIAWENNELTMTGPATTVFSGQVNIEELTRQFHDREAHRP